MSDVDRLTARFATSGKIVIEFAVQYDALIGDDWHKVVRYDNAHGQPHRHIFYPDGSAKRFVMVEADNNQAFTVAYITIKKRFKELRERYIILMKKGD